MISVTDPGYFADHPTEALRRIVERYTADSAFMAQSPFAGPDHPLTLEALAVANAAWAELFTRGET